MIREISAFVKSFLKPRFSAGKIDKEAYLYVLDKCIVKIYGKVQNSSNKKIYAEKVQALVNSYVKIVSAK